MAKILIIDDERAIRNSMREILEFEGYQVETADSGKGGLELAAKQAFDLIFSDVKCPRSMDSKYSANCKKAKHPAPSL